MCTKRTCSTPARASPLLPRWCQFLNLPDDVCRMIIEWLLPRQDKTTLQRLFREWRLTEELREAAIIRWEDRADNVFEKVDLIPALDYRYFGVDASRLSLGQRIRSSEYCFDGVRHRAPMSLILESRLEGWDDPAIGLCSYCDLECLDDNVPIIH